MVDCNTIKWHGVVFSKTCRLCWVFGTLVVTTRLGRYLGIGGMWADPLVIIPFGPRCSSVKGELL